MWIYSYLKINYLYSFSYSCINNFDCIAGCVMKSKAWCEAAFLWISGFLITLRLASNFPCSYSSLGFCHKQSQKLCKILAEQTLVLLVCFFSGCLKSFPDCNMMSIGRLCLHFRVTALTGSILLKRSFRDKVMCLTLSLGSSPCKWIWRQYLCWEEANALCSCKGASTLGKAALCWSVARREILL